MTIARSTSRISAPSACRSASGIVLDTSGSMQGDKIEHALAAIERFLERALESGRRGVRVRLFERGRAPSGLDHESARSECQLATRTRRRRHGHLRRHGRGCPDGARGRHQKKAIVLISDGNDTNSRASIRDVRQVVRETDVLVYAIGIDGRSENRRSRPRTPTFPRAPTPPIPFPIPGPWTSPAGTRRPPRNRATVRLGRRQTNDLTSRRCERSQTTVAAAPKSCPARAIWIPRPRVSRTSLRGSITSATPVPGSVTAAGTPSASRCATPRFASGRVAGTARRRSHTDGLGWPRLCSCSNDCERPL